MSLKFSDAQYIAWQRAMDAMTIYFSQNPIDYSVWSRLTTSDTPIYGPTALPSPYSASTVTVLAKLNSTRETATRIILTVRYRDGYTNNIDAVAPGLGYNLYKNVTIGAFLGIQPLSGRLTKKFDDAVAPNPITYRATPRVTSVNEGGAVVYDVVTTNIDNGTTIFWSITGTVHDSQLSARSGSATVNNNSAVITVTTVADRITQSDAPNTLILNIQEVLNGSAVASATPVSVQDTSKTPTYLLTSSANGTVVNEGTTITVNLTTENLENGYQVPWTISPTNGITANDFSSMTANGASITPSLTGNFIVQNNQSSITLVTFTDFVEEGRELMTLSLNGVGSSVSVTIADTFRPESLTFAYSGSAQTWTVPTGVSTVSITANGGGGGGGGGDSPGNGVGGLSGARVVDTVTVSPGNVLTIWTGGGGSGGYQDAQATAKAAGGSSLSGYGGGLGGGGSGSQGSGTGGGGGGATVILLNGQPILIAAGGGGGGGGGDGGSGLAQDATKKQAQPTTGQGGNGGTTSGGCGGGGGGGGLVGGAGGSAGAGGEAGGYTGWNGTNKIFSNAAVQTQLGGSGGSGGQRGTAGGNSSVVLNWTRVG